MNSVNSVTLVWSCRKLLPDTDKYGLQWFPNKEISPKFFTKFFTLCAMRSFEHSNEDNIEKWLRVIDMKMAYSIWQWTGWEWNLYCCEEVAKQLKKHVPISSHFPEWTSFVWKEKVKYFVKVCECTKQQNIFNYPCFWIIHVSSLHH